MVWASWVSGMVTLFWFVKGEGCLMVYEGACAVLLPLDVIMALEL